VGQTIQHDASLLTALAKSLVHFTTAPMLTPKMLEMHITPVAQEKRKNREQNREKTEEKQRENKEKVDEKQGKKKKKQRKNNVLFGTNRENVAV